MASALTATDSEHKGLELVAAGGCIMISAGSELKGKVELSLIDVTMTGRLTVTVDAAMFRDLFTAIGQDAVTIKFLDAKSPLIFQCGEWVSSCSCR